MKNSAFADFGSYLADDFFQSTLTVKCRPILELCNSRTQDSAWDFTGAILSVFAEATVCVRCYGSCELENAWEVLFSGSLVERRKLQRLAVKSNG